MSQELNICHYYLLVLFDLEAHNDPSAATLSPLRVSSISKLTTVIHERLIPLNPEAFFHSHILFLSLSLCLHRSSVLNEMTYICCLRESQMSTRSPVSDSHPRAAFCPQWRSGPILLCHECVCVCVTLSSFLSGYDLDYDHIQTHLWLIQDVCSTLDSKMTLKHDITDVWIHRFQFSPWYFLCIRNIWIILPPFPFR